jgi:hypothetical protein
VHRYIYGYSRGTRKPAPVASALISGCSAAKLVDDFAVEHHNFVRVSDVGGEMRGWISKLDDFPQIVGEV